MKKIKKTAKNISIVITVGLTYFIFFVSIDSPESNPIKTMAIIAGVLVGIFYLIIFLLAIVEIIHTGMEILLDKHVRNKD